MRAPMDIALLLTIVSGVLLALFFFNARTPYLRGSAILGAAGGLAIGWMSDDIIAGMMWGITVGTFWGLAFELLWYVSYGLKRWLSR